MSSLHPRPAFSQAAASSEAHHGVVESFILSAITRQKHWYRNT
jgi:hypothetical protein